MEQKVVSQRCICLCSLFEMRALIFAEKSNKKLWCGASNFIIILLVFKPDSMIIVLFHFHDTISQYSLRFYFCCCWCSFNLRCVVCVCVSVVFYSPKNDTNINGISFLLLLVKHIQWLCCFYFFFTTFFTFYSKNVYHLLCSWNMACIDILRNLLHFVYFSFPYIVLVCLCMCDNLCLFTIIIAWVSVCLTSSFLIFSSRFHVVCLVLYRCTAHATSKMCTTYTKKPATTKIIHLMVNSVWKIKTHSYTINKIEELWRKMVERKMQDNINYYDRPLILRSI